MDQSLKDSIITSIKDANSKEDMFKGLYSSMEKLFEKEINNLIQSSGGRYFDYYGRYRANIHGDDYSDENFDTDSDSDSDHKADKIINKKFYETDSESESDTKEDIIAIPKEFGLLAYLIREEIHKGNIMIMDCESCSAFTADDINGFKDGKKKKLLISNPR